MRSECSVFAEYALFITESINDISKNYNWIKNRNNPNDIVIDLHGNVIKLQEFLV